MERIQALIFDIDRTLVVLGSPPSARTVEAVERCRLAGLPCFVATARSQNSARKTLGPLGWLAESGVFQNGAVGACSLSGFAAVEDMPASVVEIAMAAMSGLASEPGVQVSIHTGDNRPAFLHPVAEDVLQQWGYDPARLREFSQAAHQRSCRIMLWTEVECDLRGIAADLERSLADRACVHFFDSGTSITITAPGCDKGSMAVRLLSHRGIDPATAAAFGDDVTDVPLLKAVGHGVAMADGHPAARAIARSCTSSAREDGVAIVLERLGLI